MTHLKLGEILIHQGLITEKQLQEAIVAQKKEKGRIGEVLVKIGLITEEHMAEALGTQMGIPHYSSKNLDLLKPQPDQGLEKMIPAEFAKKHCVLPLSRHLNSLTCVVHDPLDLLLLDNLKRIAGCEINLVIATPTAIQGAVNDFYFKQSNDGSPSMLDRAVERSYTQSKNNDLTVLVKEDGGA